MNRTFYKGIIFFLFSCLQIFLPKRLVSWEILTIFSFLFNISIVLISDGITQKISKKSLLQEICRSKKNIAHFLLISVAGGIILDGVAQWLGKLWVYPYFNFYIYLLFFVPGFGLYWLMIAESYLATKAIIDYLRKGKQVVRNYFSFEPRLYRLLGIIGIILIPLSVIFMLHDYFVQSGYIFDVSNPVNYKVNFVYVIAIFLGTWFVLEYIEYSRKKTSLLKDIFHHYSSSLISILIASFVLAIIMEFENIPVGFWIYTNWPLEHIRVFGLPLIMFIAWPLHYIVFLSLFRAFTEKESDEIWRGDLIK
ncbi:MAG: hypothetical protein CEN91_391 [Candidatus Berkelbacteria bacterium Licking1014_85]|uniref:Uncharacterized protein n=1 Tax=Candidatus Berkelbacteria bacterium Licking1014_85 TaxID=2017148 RepID=A0A554LIC0_9BACT|nr:MAG: hypothetical protein CEN91_391 [Candidatus Berkelbacteria bacterium Licking1014_85]